MKWAGVIGLSVIVVAGTAEFRRSFGPHKCCQSQISGLGFIISWWQLSCEIFLQILTSLELHSNSANRPGILLSHDGSLEVNLLMIFLELSLKKTSQKTKSDICGWQHLRVPKYLLDTRVRRLWRKHLQVALLRVVQAVVILARLRTAS